MSAESEMYIYSVIEHRIGNDCLAYPTATRRGTFEGRGSLRAGGFGRRLAARNKPPGNTRRDGARTRRRDGRATARSPHDANAQMGAVNFSRPCGTGEFPPE
jgi:hypothetical protein